MGRGAPHGARSCSSIRHGVWWWWREAHTCHCVLSLAHALSGAPADRQTGELEDTSSYHSRSIIDNPESQGNRRLQLHVLTLGQAIDHFHFPCRPLAGVVVWQG